MAAARRSFVLLAMLGLAAAARTGSAFDIGSAPYFGSFGIKPPNPPGFLGSLTVQNAVYDATGELYVVETTRISKFDHNGNLELTWPCVACYGIDVNQATGDVYVTLGPLSLVQQFTSTGTLVRQWGSFGTGNGQFNGQHGIAVDPVTGDVFVWDTGNSRIEVFDGTGVYLRQFGQKGSGPGAFSGVASPGGLAFDSVNRWLYVTDPPFARVSKFAEDGTFLLEWGDPSGSTPGHFHWPRSVEVDGSGNVYVTDTDSERIQYFTNDGTYLGQFQGPQNVVQGPFHPRDIAVNRITGEKYVNASYAFREDKFDPNDLYLQSWGGKYTAGSYLDQPMGVSVDPTNGDVVLVDPSAFLFKRFTEGGAFKRTWSWSYRVDITMPGGTGQGNHTAVSVAPDGSVWTGTVGTFYSDNPPVPWIYRFDPKGVVTASADRKLVVANYGELISDVAVEPTSGDVFVSDASFNHLRRVTSSGTDYLDYKLQTPGGLSYVNGKLYVVHQPTGTVQRYTDQFVLEATFGSPGTGSGQFNFDLQSGIAVRASDGHIFVADTHNNRIQELNPDGSFAAMRGAYGGAPGQFAQPEDVALSNGGDVLYVANSFDHRIDMFCLSTIQACNAIVDEDGDGLRDYQDNCPYEKNADQKDSGGFETTVPDGIGDVCQCGDLTGDGIVDAGDLPPYRAHLTQDPAAPFLAARKCKIATDGGPCSIVDVAVLERALNRRGPLSPGISQACAAATTLGP